MKSQIDRLISDGRIVVGANAVGHDSSLVYYDRESGEIFALDAERISRIKHDGSSIKDCCRELFRFSRKAFSGIDINEGYLTEETFEQKNYLLFKQISPEIKKIFNINYVHDLNVYLSLDKYALLFKLLKRFPKSWRVFYLLLTKGLLNKYNKDSADNLRNYIKHDLKGLKFNRLHTNFYDHHLCHCVGAYYFSPFNECLSISMDYSGDGVFSRVFLCDKGEMREIAKSPLVYTDDNSVLSIGKIYTAITSYLGFIPNSDEGKIEALAAYGNGNNELYYNLAENTFIKDNNEISFNKQVINFIRPEYLDKMTKKLGPEGIAAAVQDYLEEAVVAYIDRIMTKNRIYNVCLSGGTFANVKLNMAILEKTAMKNQYVFPAMSDSGVAVGGLLLRLKELGWIGPQTFKNGRYKMPYWGAEYSDEEIQAVLRRYQDKIKVKYLGDSWPEIVAELVCSGKIGAIFQGRCEYGPRALGNRSILADSRSVSSRERLNSVIKGRPAFQPFCPSVLEEDRSELFVKSYPNKHMTCAFRMKGEYVKRFPSAVHVDGTGRPQFVEQQDNPNFYRLLKKVKEIIGKGILINTSFNKHGRAMVLKPEHAIIDFIDSQMDFLCLNGYLLTR